MKKLLYLFIASTILISCSSNDDSLENSDFIIGSWKLTHEYGTEVSDCEKKSTIVFKSSNFSTSPYNFDINDNCISLGTSNGIWANNDDIYTLERDGIVLEVKIEFSNNDTINFIEDNEEAYTYKRD